MADPRDTTVHNPGNRAHYMRLRPLGQRLLVHAGGQKLAESGDALTLIEVGKDIYDPVFYVPKADITDALVPIEDMTTHCPLKGDAHYFSLTGASEPIAWIYDEPLDFAQALGDHVAFYPTKVTISVIGGDDPSQP